ncbi:MAG: bifunctional chorismate mutase/prephenate dehydrogenase [Prochloraceae cyanobacterium]
MMISEKIKQIDRQLIELIGERIKLLERSDGSYPLENPELIPLLEQAGIPEFVWKNLAIDCAASLTIKASSSTLNNRRSKRITIIGGKGMMGRFFTARLSAAGHDVKILESHDWERAEQLLNSADLVLVCVPIECSIEVIKKASKYLSPDTALADIASIKSPIVKAMLEYHNGPVMGLHPMFGPQIKSFLGQKVIVCSGREDRAFQWLLDLIKNEGGKLIFATPEEHDRMMVDIQAIRNFTTFSMGVFLSEEGIDINRSLDFSSPLYRHNIAVVTRLFAQSAPLIVDIILATPERHQAISKLANTYSRLAELVNQGDRDGLILEFQRAQNFFARSIPCGLKESTYIINSLNNFLAAQEQEQKQKYQFSLNNCPSNFTKISSQKTPALSN